MKSIQITKIGGPEVLELKETKLDKPKENEVIKDLPTFGVFIYLNTALIYFDIKKQTQHKEF